MANSMNVVLGLMPRAAACGLRMLGVPAGTRRVKNLIGERHALVIGREDRRFNRTITELYKPDIVPPFVNDLETVRREIDSFSPKTVKEVLQKMEDYLAAWGSRPVANYFYRFAKSTEGTLVYGDVTNTSEARSAFLSAAYKGRPLVRIDRQIVKGEITGPINDLIHLSRFHLYGIDTMLIKLGYYYGSPRSFVVIPVYDEAGRILGKINIGLRETNGLALEKIEILRQLSEKIRYAKQERDDAQMVVNTARVNEFVGNLARTNIFRFLPFFLLPALARRTHEIVELLDASIGRARSINRAREEERLRSYEQIIQVLADAIETKESYTGGHCIRVAEVGEAIGKNLPQATWIEEIGRKRDRKGDEEELINLEKELLFARILIHDLGKIGVSDEILNKPGKPTDEELKIIRQHPEMGARIIKRAMQRHPENELLKSAADAIFLHHVDYDGFGYPAVEGMKGEQLPLVARIARVADSYHTMISRRSYKEAKPPKFVITELVNGVGTSYDPIVVRTFLEILSRKDGTGNLADADIMMEETKAVQEKLREDDDAQRSLLEKLMAKLRGGESVDDLNTYIDSRSKGRMVLESSNELFQEILARYQNQKKELIEYSELCLQFNNSLLPDIIGIVAEFSQTADYDPTVVRLFMGKLLGVWISNRERAPIELMIEAFKQIDHPNLAGFRKFFFDRI